MTLAAFGFSTTCKHSLSWFPALNSAQSPTSPLYRANDFFTNVENLRTVLKLRENCFVIPFLTVTDIKHVFQTPGKKRIFTVKKKNWKVPKLEQK